MEKQTKFKWKNEQRKIIIEAISQGILFTLTVLNDENSVAADLFDASHEQISNLLKFLTCLATDSAESINSNSELEEFLRQVFILNSSISEIARKPSMYDKMLELETEDDHVSMPA